MDCTGRNLGAGEESRTPDLRITNALLYQLSYTGLSGSAEFLLHNAEKKYYMRHQQNCKYLQIFCIFSFLQAFFPFLMTSELHLPAPSVLSLPDESHTERLAQLSARAALKFLPEIREKGFNIRLEGTLGAGKTTFARAFLRSLGVTGRVRSPTFTLVETYAPEDFAAVNHFDFYRFESPEEFDDAGFRDLFGSDRVTLCEWSERAGDYLPQADLVIALAASGEGRAARLEACSALGSEIFTEVTSAWH